MKPVILLSLLFTSACVDKTCPEPAVNDGDRCICPEGMEWTGTGCGEIPDWDAGSDAGRDSGSDTEVPDTSPDVGRDVSDDVGRPPSEDAVLRFPWNGYYTGSLHVPGTVPNPPLRPRFIWEPVADADEYEIQLDDSCERAATCDFPTPEVHQRTVDTFFRPELPLTVPSTSPVGSRYFWRVRACRGASCSGWTTARYLNVGRVQGDLDGDGYPEVVITEPELETGGVFRVYSGNEYFDGGTPRSFPGDGWYAIASGDIDGDGFSDFATTNLLVNRLTIYWGGPGGIEAATTTSASVAPMAAMAISDVDGDGFDDVVHGGSDGVSIRFGGERSAPIREVEASPVVSEWGLRAVGDLDGDGLTDVVVKSGTDFLLLDAAGDVRNIDVTGRSFCVTDIDQDGLLDVVVSRVRIEPAQTTLVAYRGTNTGLSDREVSLAMTNARWSPDHALACGDFGGDGQITVGVGGDAGIWFASDTSQYVVTLPTSSLAAAKCSSISVGDADSDGRDDLHCGDISFRRERTTNGVVFSFRGREEDLRLNREILAESFSTLGAAIAN